MRTRMTGYVPRRVAAIIALLIAILCVLLLGAARPTQARVAAATLPPLPTLPAPTLAPPPPRPDGRIELNVRFNLATAARWQQAWTVVQWQDGAGHWHDVEGWRGTLDEISYPTGRKVWWVARSDLGKGPFRWLVYNRLGGKLKAKSHAFNLPAAPGQAVTVEVALAP